MSFYFSNIINLGGFGIGNKLELGQEQNKLKLASETNLSETNVSKNLNKMISNTLSELYQKMYLR